MEDPSDEFVALRDFVDCRNAMKVESFQSPKIHQPFSKELEELCRQKLKLHKVKRETERERESGRGRERGGRQRGRKRERERRGEEDRWLIGSISPWYHLLCVLYPILNIIFLFLHIASVTEGV